MSLLICNHVSKTYRKNGSTITAVNSASLTLTKGEFIAVQGPSGSGKTTLLLIAGALLNPDSGTVMIADDSLYALTGKQRAQIRASTIGFVFQQFHLIPYLTVSQNIQAPSLALNRKESNERINFLLEKFYLENRANHFPSELSAGEKQRVACARALYNKPSIILADEPTGNLDRDTAQSVISFLHDFSRNDGAVVMVSHSDKAVESADTFFQMIDGNLIKQ
jgi:ABC-type lipoprotein export system ATPase subunit